jgi:hypothetical protein
MKSVATSPLPYVVQKSVYFGIFGNLAYAGVSSSSPPQKRYFPHIRVKHLWNKKGTFSTFLTKMAYL